MKYLFIAITLITLNLFAAETKSIFNCEEKLGSTLYNILGTHAFDSKEEAIAAGWSFNEENRFNIGEIVVYEKDNGKMIYGIVYSIDEYQSTISFGYGFINGTYHTSFFSQSKDLRMQGSNLLGKF